MVDYYTITLPHDVTEGIVSIAVVSSASRLEHGITFAVYNIHVFSGQMKMKTLAGQTLKLTQVLFH